MRFEELFAFDADLKVALLDSLAASVPNVHLALAEDISAGAVIFVKNSKYLKVLQEKIWQNPMPQTVGIFDHQLWEGLSPETRLDWQSRLGGIATSTNVPLSMARLSKPVFQKQFGELQSVVDGRQLGNVAIHPSALIAQGVFIGEHVKIGAGSVIHPGVTIAPRVEIASGVTIFSNVAIYPFSKLGHNVRIHSNTTIGSDGFGYVFERGVHHKIWHTGGVIIQDDVEVGANCSVDMGTFTPTVIGSGSRIDNQVQIAHNVKIGKGCVLCGQVGIAGSTVLGDYVVLGGRAAIGPDANIGQGTQIAGGAMVNEGAVWPAGSVLGGHPARDLKEWMRTFAWVRKNALKS